MIHEFLETKIDLDKARYDLALEYAKILLVKAMDDPQRRIYDPLPPDHINEMDYFMDRFLDAFGYYATCPDEGLMNTISGERLHPVQT